MLKIEKLVMFKRTKNLPVLRLSSARMRSKTRKQTQQLFEDGKIVYLENPGNITENLLGKKNKTKQNSGSERATGWPPQVYAGFILVNVPIELLKSGRSFCFNHGLIYPISLLTVHSLQSYYILKIKVQSLLRVLGMLTKTDHTLFLQKKNLSKFQKAGIII